MGILFFIYNNFALLIQCRLVAAWNSGELFAVSGATPYRFILYGALILAFVYFLVMAQTGSLIKTKKLLKDKEMALDLIERQKHELEIKDKNITDSLNYAQRIQEALLPSEAYFRNYIKDSFIFFKPKDIISGDFYWIGESGDKIFIVAADCTGHGVPGALMSMIGMEIIEKTIIEDNIENPARILSVLNKGLEKTFSREKNVGTIIRDGMDIGLCVVDIKEKKLEYSGAFIPLYLIRDSALIEMRGDKLIIGMNPADIPYTSHKLDIQEDDIFYMFSDGYVDQFGGSENKKFMYRRFRYLLMTIHRFPVNDQKAILDDNIKTWMKENVQIDDLTIIGFRPLGKKA